MQVLDWIGRGLLRRPVVPPVLNVSFWIVYVVDHRSGALLFHPNVLNMPQSFPAHAAKSFSRCGDSGSSLASAYLWPRFFLLPCTCPLEVAPI